MIAIKAFMSKSREGKKSRVGLKGFTLIELAVVIIIIGILSTVVALNVSGSKGASYDAKRISDVKAIGDALRLYNSDNSTYPTDSSDWICKGCGNDAPWTTLEAQLSTYISPLPVDPKNTAGSRYYIDLIDFAAGFTADGAMIKTKLESNTAPMSKDACPSNTSNYEILQGKYNVQADFNSRCSEKPTN